MSIEGREHIINHPEDGLAVSRFMAENGLKTAYVRRECQIGLAD